MDPDHHQETMINEVLYLHSLYNYGPPPATSSPPPPPRRPARPPIGRYLATITGWSRQTPFQKNLHSTNHTRFKKPISKKPKKKEKQHFSGKEWPVKPPVDQSPSTLSGWPELKLKPKVKNPTKQELEISNWNQTQVKAVEKVKDFYKLNQEDDDVSNDCMDGDDDASSEDDMEDGFYWELFNGDEDLKEKYVKGCLGGVCEFTCLVCGGAGEKFGKRFKDCVGLVQHAVTVNKTKRRRGHRVFGKVVCRVLGWDIDRLPSSRVAECKNGELQGTDNTVDKDFNTASSSMGLNQIMDSGNSNRKADDVSEVVDGESMVCEDSAVITNVEEENRKKQVLDETVGNCHQSCEDLELVINNGTGSSTSKKVDDME